MEEPFYPNKLQQLRDQNISRITTVLPSTHTHRMPLPEYYKLSYNLATNTKIEKHTSKSVLQPWARLCSPHHHCRHSLPSRSNRFFSILPCFHFLQPKQELPTRSNKPRSSTKLHTPNQQSVLYQPPFTPHHACHTGMPSLPHRNLRV